MKMLSIMAMLMMGLMGSINNPRHFLAVISICIAQIFQVDDEE